MSATVLTDEDVRRRITADGLDELLFVEAGAGTGKTSQLVGRVAALVFDRGVPMREIAAITFTEAAASELRTRIRETFERRAHDPATDPATRASAEQALTEIDVAAIGTVHAFAQRILSEHPVEAGLPPHVEVLDEVESLLEFGERWRNHVDAMYADPGLAPILAHAALLRIRIDGTKVSSLRDVASVFADNWDRLDPLLGETRELEPLARDAAIAAMDALEPVLARCAEIADDKLAAYILDRHPAMERTRRALESADDRALLRTIAGMERWERGGVGTRTNWGSPEEKEAVRSVVGGAYDAVMELRAAAVDAVLRILAAQVARFTVESAAARRRAGRLEFHDLLVLARELLRTSPEARGALSRRYSRLLIDEFQDTDPIQIELATLIAASVTSVAPGTPWPDIPVDPTRLFFVGDPKQSIYRFRRADIELFAAARDAFAATPARLVTNFRTVPTVLAWVNHVFGVLMAEEGPGRPVYEPLAAHRADEADHRVTLLGGPHAKEEKLRAGPLRELEAGSVADAIAAILAEPEQWPVSGPEGWRPARPEDIAILVPTRTSLPALMDALRDRDVEFRSETGTLVYETQEIRDLLSILRAIAHGLDAVALVAALRSPILGCGDDDLVTYVAAGGRWDLGARSPDSLDADHAVVAAMNYLRTLRADRWWTAPSELLARIIEERRVMTIALAAPRPRDTWRRLRFIVDQARLYEASQSADLVGFVAWADLQRSEMARVHEPSLPESDDHAVRIMTIHGAKGLEFPITVVSGLTTRLGHRRRRFSVQWHEDGVEVSARSDAKTTDFDRLSDLEAEMDEAEKLRLLYVACTRARDHLVVATHHIEGTPCFAQLVWDAAAAAPESCVRRESPVPALRVIPDLPPPVPFDADARAAWFAARRELLVGTARSRVVAATAVRRALATSKAATDSTIATDGQMPGDAVDPDGSTLAPDPWGRGRAATAFGRAVHTVLQDVDLDDPSGIVDLALAAARAEGISDRADAVGEAARSVWDAPVMRRAGALPEVDVRREAYVAAPVAGVTLEGYIDLLLREADGLIIVDYKTDALAVPGEAEIRAEEYRAQLAVYALALEAASGRPVVGGVLVFAAPGGAIEWTFTRSELDTDAVVAGLAP